MVPRPRAARSWGAARRPRARVPARRRRPSATRGVERGADATFLRSRCRAGRGRHARVRGGARSRDARDRTRVRSGGRGAPHGAPRRAGGNGPLQRRRVLRDLGTVRWPARRRHAARREWSECRIPPDPRVAAGIGRGRDRVRDLRRLRGLGRARSAGTHRSEPPAVRGPPPRRPVDGHRDRCRVGARAGRRPQACGGDRRTPGAARHAGAPAGRRLRDRGTRAGRAGARR